MELGQKRSTRPHKILGGQWPASREGRESSRACYNPLLFYSSFYAVALVGHAACVRKSLLSVLAGDSECTNHDAGGALAYTCTAVLSSAMFGPFEDMEIEHYLPKDPFNLDCLRMNYSFPGKLSSNPRSDASRLHPSLQIHPPPPPSNTNDAANTCLRHGTKLARSSVP